MFFNLLILTQYSLLSQNLKEGLEYDSYEISEDEVEFFVKYQVTEEGEVVIRRMNHDIDSYEEVPEELWDDVLALCGNFEEYALEEAQRQLADEDFDSTLA